jgi:hypothetical protein
MEPKVRQTVTLSKFTSEKIHQVAENLGMTQTAVINMAILTGLDAISMAINPELKDFFEKMGEKYEKKTE